MSAVWPPPRPLVEHDDNAGATIIDGIRYANGYFHAFGHAPIGSFIRIEARKDGTLTCRSFSADLQEKFCKIAGLT